MRAKRFDDERHDLEGEDVLGDDLDQLLVEESEDPRFRSAFEDAAARSRTLASLIRARRDSGLSQAAVATRMGTSQSAVSELESGDTDPRVSTLQRYARAVGHALDLQLAAPWSPAFQGLSPVVLMPGTHHAHALAGEWMAWEGTGAASPARWLTVAAGEGLDAFDIEEGGDDYLALAW